MSVSKAIVERIKSLINEGTPLSHAVKKQFGYTFKEEQDAEGWLTSAAHIVELIIRDPTNAYRMKCLSLVASSQVKIGRREGVTKEHVGSMIGVLENLMRDIDAGLIASLADRVRAEVFDEFLDHAEAYHKEGRKESGVIAGVVFEDTMRRIAQKHRADDPKIDTIITNLVKKDVFTEVKAKRARAAADVRTKATHARWSEFDLSDVQTCIGFTRELIANHLD